MEIFQTEKYYIFVKQDKNLWWNRKTSEFTLKSGWDLSSVGDIECIGVCAGIIGIISLPGVFDPHLIVIKESTPVGVLYPPHLVYKIKSICMLSDDEPDTSLTPCSRHNSSRGSVPVYWSQPGYKYRPPPRLDKDETETQLAFQKHFDQELSIYNNIYIINLVEQSGKEKVIFDAYGTHIIKYNSEKLLRGMRFENVSALIEALAPEAGAMGFYWKDARGAEHARLLVEDCRRLLLGSAQYPVGAWGLIDADPTTGDPNETEVDCILLLTDEFYLVAEYDSHLDKIIRFEKVPLSNVTLIEFGLVQQSKMFQSGTITHLCIRLNYAVDGVDGYFHMFRSPNIRFFNNVAVVINTQDEVMGELQLIWNGIESHVTHLSESLLAIIEIFRIALENCGNKDVKIVSAGTLQRRKSKVPALDVPKGIPRNLSESQLLHIGSKALSNVAGQFSKLGQSLNRSTKKKSNNTNAPTLHNQQNSFTVSGQHPADSEHGEAQFSVGSSRKANSDTSDSDDNDCSIYEPDVNDLVQENPIYNENTFLPSVGIVMGSNEGSTVNSLGNRDPMAKLSSDVCTMSISSVTDHVQMPAGMLESASPIRSRSPAPEIRVQNIVDIDNIGNSIGQSFSHSAHEMRADATDHRSTQQRDLSLNLSSSQSENALKQLKTLTSPLSKLAKGMQNFGMNLDPRKITVKLQLSSTGAQKKREITKKRIFILFNQVFFT
ncbi:Phosphatidylinositide phosphatase SAC2 [Pseudolycoriella hygida]|uniref:Phosphatidylinositide phosphatase SAC2 n=1 Tax=Pseudolycoriella hygida TaxID=35572 RepID=A0A9Q0S163_9DIPT|nr:Phosphatidylinositide phosphatase SAC2 [Pseudolycoriella hygida]